MDSRQWFRLESESANQGIRMNESVAPKDAGVRILVWDLPARVSHWGFSLSLTISLWLGFRTDPESAVFKYHILAGIMACWFLAARIVLGFVGSRPMRWSAFFEAMTQIREYAGSVIAWRPTDHVGLNAGSSVFALALYLAVVAVVCTGFVADWVETWHGRLAYGCIALIAVHLLGLSAHALRQRELSPLAMVHGMRRGKTTHGLATPRSAAGWFLIGLGLGVAWLLMHYFDEPTSVLKIPYLPEVCFPVIQKG